MAASDKQASALDAKRARKKRSRRAGEYRIGNPLLGALSIAVIIALTAASFFIDSMPLIGAGPKYTAYFSEAAGLKPDDEVRIAGIKVGVVSSVELEGDKVRVQFRSKDAWIGDNTHASIQIKTVLGQKYVVLDPAGANELDPDTPIGLDRTTSPYDVVTAFSQAAEVIEEIDPDQLATSLDAVADTMDLPDGEFRNAVDGVSRLSQTISSRDQELSRLLEATRTSASLVAERNDEFQRLIEGTGTLLTELNNRKESIQLVLDASAALSSELRLLVADNEEIFGPTLNELDSALGILTDHEQDLRDSLHNLAPFYRLYGNMLGSGRWFDSVVTNLMPPGLPEIPGFRDPVRPEGVR